MTTAALACTAPVADPDQLDADLVFEILRAAVTLAKNEQVRRRDTLRKSLLELYPRHEAECDAALKTWAGYAATSKQISSAY